MEPLQRAEKAAAALLGRKMYTCRELYDRLRRKDFSEEVAQEVVSAFMKAGYLNDQQYAQLYIEDAIRIGGKGTYRIRQELLQKGVSASLIDEAMGECEASTQEALNAYVEQRQLWKEIHSRKDLERVKARLVRRGYSLGEIRNCLSEYTFHFEEE